MKIGIHQPNYLPYLGFFDKMQNSDIFVIYDDAQFNKEDFQHRNKIRIFSGWKWLTVPVEKKIAPINEIKINNEIMRKRYYWFEEHINIINENYNKAPYHKLYIKELEKIYMEKHYKLLDLNCELIKFLMKSFNINTKIIFSSELGIDLRSSEKLVNIVDALNGDIYLSGPMGRNYLDISLFEKKGIKVEFQYFKHPIYRQQFPGYESNMSAIDALFNINRIPEME